MRRSRIFVALMATTVVGLIGVTGAAAIPPDNDYEGRAEKDPQTYVGFDVSSKDGVRKIAKVKASLQYACRNSGGGALFGIAKGQLRVKSDDTFAGKLEVRPQLVTRRGSASQFDDMTYEITGKLGKKGKAKGTIDASLRYTPGMMRGGETTTCFSGGLDWKAKRGADTSPTTPFRTEGLR